MMVFISHRITVQIGVQINQGIIGSPNILKLLIANNYFFAGTYGLIPFRAVLLSEISRNPKHQHRNTIVIFTVAKLSEPV